MMRKNKLFIVSAMAGQFNKGNIKKVFYVYEMTPKGHLHQKHGSNEDGLPFESKADASCWISKKMNDGSIDCIDNLPASKSE